MITFWISVGYVACSIFLFLMMLIPSKSSPFARICASSFSTKEIWALQSETVHCLKIGQPPEWESHKAWQLLKMTEKKWKKHDLKNLKFHSFTSFNVNQLQASSWLISFRSTPGRSQKSSGLHLQHAWFSPASDLGSWPLREYFDLPSYILVYPCQKLLINYFEELFD